MGRPRPVTAYAHGEMSQTSDARRVESIARYDVLDHPPRRELQALTELAAQVCDMPISTINLLTDTEQHHLAAYGIDPMICAREDSLCAAVFNEEASVVITDARIDPRLADHPLVTGEDAKIRFYASHQLVTLEGVAIGTLCVYDTVPRTLSVEQVASLATLADRVVDVLELSLRSRQLAASNERLSGFAGRVSHDLKSPLTSVALSLGLLEEALQEGADPVELQRLVQRALRGSERMAEMIDEVLTYAHHGAGPTRNPVALEEVLDEVIVDLDGALAGAHLERGPLPTVAGDRVQLRSLLQNLLDNCAKHQHPDRPLDMRVSAAGRGDRWRIEVADNGLGIPVAERTRVFEPRVRLSTEVAGEGIGLDTCRSVVQDHGGRIGLEETPGGGTTVWFELPG